MSKPQKNSEAPLHISIENEKLNISVGLDVLRHSCEIGLRYGLPTIKITNFSDFLSSFESQLKSEEEDGSTLIHEAFDQAILNMIENGEAGIEATYD